MDIIAGPAVGETLEVVVIEVTGYHHEAIHPYDGADPLIIYGSDGHRVEVVHHPEKHS